MRKYVPRRRIPKLWRPVRAGIWYEPVDGDSMATADHVIDEPREPRLIPTGILDANGEMLIRVVVPIKVKMGFHCPGLEPAEEEVMTILPESLIHIAEDLPGEGIGWVDAAELDAEQEEDDDADPQAAQ